MKLVLTENPDISNAKLVEHMSEAAKIIIHAKYFVIGNLLNPSPSSTE